MQVLKDIRHGSKLYTKWTLRKGKELIISLRSRKSFALFFSVPNEHLQSFFGRRGILWKLIQAPKPLFLEVIYKAGLVELQKSAIDLLAQWAVLLNCDSVIASIK